LVCVLSTLPLLWIGQLGLGVVPTVRRSFRPADRIGLFAFAAEGWMFAGLGIAWPIILFSSLGSSYNALGWASGAAAMAGALAGLGRGIGIDRGHRHLLCRGVTVALSIGVAARVVSAWVPNVAFAAHIFGAAVGGLYYPVLMSVVYDRAKRSGSAYQFHLSAEAGWDAGAILGCLATAAVIFSGVPLPLALLPSVLGVLVIQRCVRAETIAAAAPVPKAAAPLTEELLAA
jgi:DHA1 family inner membrane transport protein